MLAARLWLTVDLGLEEDLQRTMISERWQDPAAAITKTMTMKR